MGRRDILVFVIYGRIQHVLRRLVSLHDLTVSEHRTAAFVSSGTFETFALRAQADNRAWISTYLADAYETYSSSAQAAQSFTRNLSGGIFPLFARQLVRISCRLPLSIGV